MTQAAVAEPCSLKGIVLSTIINTLAGAENFSVFNKLSKSDQKYFADSKLFIGGTPSPRVIARFFDMVKRSQGFSDLSNMMVDELKSGKDSCLTATRCLDHEHFLELVSTEDKAGDFLLKLLPVLSYDADAFILKAANLATLLPKINELQFPDSLILEIEPADLKFLTPPSSRSDLALVSAAEHDFCGKDESFSYKGEVYDISSLSSYTIGSSFVSIARVSASTENASLMDYGDDGICSELLLGEHSEGRGESTVANSASTSPVPRLFLLLKPWNAHSLLNVISESSAALPPDSARGSACDTTRYTACDAAWSLQFHSHFDPFDFLCPNAVNNLMALQSRIKSSVQKLEISKDDIPQGLTKARYVLSKRKLFDELINEL